MKPGRGRAAAHGAAESAEGRTDDILDVVRDPERLATLHRTALLDTQGGAAFDRLTQLAARLLRVPVAMVALVDGDRQYFTSHVGLPEPFATTRQTPLTHSFCKHVVLTQEPLVIEDARTDAELQHNPAIHELGIIAYLGIPLLTRDGVPLGSFCVIDHAPRRWSDDDVQLARDLAASVMTEIELRLEVRELADREQALRQSEQKFRLLQRVTVAMSGAGSTSEALQLALDRVCEFTGWRIGHAHIRDAADGHLAPTAIWHLEDPARFEAFRRVSEQLRFAPGVGLPGTVLTTRRPQWIVDVTKEPNFPRARLAHDIGVKAAFAFPILVHGDVVAVLEFFSPEAAEPDPALLGLMATIGTQLGGVFERIRVHETLQESEERFRSVAQNATDAIITLDREDRILFANPAAEKIFGYSIAELTRIPFTTLIPERLRDAHRAGIQRHIATGVKRIPWDGIELPGLHRSGREIPLEITFGKFAREGEYFFTGIMRDITARKRAEEGLRLLAEAGEVVAASLDSRETFTALARLVAGSFLADFCLIDVVDDVTGRSCRIATAHRDAARQQLLERALPLPLDAERSPIARPFRTANPELITAFTDEAVAALAHDEDMGRRIRELDATSLLAVPLVARDGVLGVITFGSAESGRVYDAQDVELASDLASRAALAADNARLFREARRRAREEEALRAGAHAVTTAFTVREVVAAIAESASRAMGADCAFVEAVDAECGEVEVAAATGANAPRPGTRRPYRGSVAEAVIERGDPAIVLDGGATVQPAAEELAAAFPSHSALTVPLLDAGGVIGALTLLRGPERPPFRSDELARGQVFGNIAALAFRRVHLLEEAERRRDELLQVMESRSRLMRGFSHDVKNPLGAADGYLELLEVGIYGEIGPAQKESVQRARRSVHRALELIESLLELARAEAGNIEIERHAIDVRPIAREMVEEYRAKAEAEGLTLRAEVPDALPKIESDDNRIRQVLGNLLSNAVKYTERGGITVRVEARERNGSAPAGWITIAVTDTGPGIPPEKHHLVFHEFKRIDPGSEPGAGVGLAISRRVAQALGGEIRLHSEPGRGSTFTLWLPVEAPADRRVNERRL